MIHVLVTRGGLVLNNTDQVVGRIKNQFNEKTKKCKVVEWKDWTSEEITDLENAFEVIEEFRKLRMEIIDIRLFWWKNRDGSYYYVHMNEFLNLWRNGKLEGNKLIFH